MKVRSLYIYPVKSLAGIPVTRLELDEFGPRGDRRWMLVDDQNRFITQRQLPQLANVRTSLEEGCVVVQIPEEGRYRLEPGSETAGVTVWKDQVVGTMGAEAAGLALSRYCGTSLRFVYMDDDSYRRVDREWVSEPRRVGFADGFPFLVVNQSSLEELNSRLELAIDMRRFRPNIVIEGADAWEEDVWQTMRIGDVQLQLVKPCSRCVMTTVDPDTGKKDTDVQPLKTLAGYRKTPNGIIFGQNAVHDSVGTIAVGDSVTVLKQEN
ncbi:MOSC domain-containing protein [Marinobacter daepoensis]|uniref:MOSC domain-containing protein n=1 Tax=Marinobacter daepoensis TaxID=262077 RepID=A0ABS3BBJ6_9GAMM|nr:MOSC N-terminal beta barrel domain-containing protein [Marinobacter daepoensis]MBN7769233.1 MOSC domain-containing protein [Marinobacter daepoensis]MBY6077923.1 MOSC domain-containing protein [Marinobacter daepoensis]